MHRDLKAENLLLDNNMNIKIAGNWDTAGYNISAVSLCPGCVQKRTCRQRFGGISTDDIKLSQKKMCFFHFLSSLCVLKSKGNQFILVYTMAGLKLGSDLCLQSNLCPGPFLGLCQRRYICLPVCEWRDK